ncbi:MAG: hypothetical protein V2J08_15175 [Desulfotignum sp.]|jgi:hypothetical protein|nr:hypothetical protein [Desulfotignum sp.]
MENVPEIFHYAKLPSWNQKTVNSRLRDKSRRPLKRRTSGKYYALTRLANDTHQTLKDNNSPLRLCVHGSENDLYLNVVTMGNNKKINKSFTRPITNSSLNSLVKNIHNQMGLIIDYRV